MKVKMSAALLGLSVLLASCGGGTDSPPADKTPPTVTVTATQTGTQVKLSATVSDASPVSRVEFYRGNSTTPLTVDTAAPYETALTVSSADNGAANFTVKAYDSAGNVGSASTNLNIYVAPPAPTPVGKTLYQGVWAWLIFSNDAKTVVRSGLAVLNGEENDDYGKVANGGYGEYAVATDPKSTLRARGAVVLGPLTGAGQLQTRFITTYQGAATLEILADDDDNRWDALSDGSAFFFDDDAEIRVPGGQTYSAPFVLTQISMDVPASAQTLLFPDAQALLKRGKTPALAAQGQAVPLAPAMVRQLATKFTQTLTR